MAKIVILGCGALGSQIAMHLALPEHNFVLIDDDEVDEHNVLTGTSAYSTHHIGMRKAMVLAELLYRKAGCLSRCYARTFEGRNLWGEAGLIVDAFDDAQARIASQDSALETGTPILHVGVGEGGVGMAAWGEKFAFPVATGERGVNPVCTHQLGGRILRLTAVVAACAAEDFLATRERQDVLITTNLEVVK